MAKATKRTRTQTKRVRKDTRMKPARRLTKDTRMEIEKPVTKDTRMVVESMPKDMGMEVEKAGEGGEGGEEG